MKNIGKFFLAFLLSTSLHALHAQDKVLEYSLNEDWGTPLVIAVPVGQTEYSCWQISQFIQLAGLRPATSQELVIHGPESLKNNADVGRLVALGSIFSTDRGFAVVSIARESSPKTLQYHHYDSEVWKAGVGTFFLVFQK